MPTHAAIRARFPALSGPTALLENAGGSQVPECVPDAIREYMRTRYVQLGAGYPLSRAADDVVAGAHAFAETFVGGAGTGVAALGPSSSQLCAMLAQAYGDVMERGDNVVIVETAHESNAGPWARLERRGIEVRTWKVDPETFACPLEGLDALLDERTRIVALVHVSNLIGEIVDVAEIARRARAVGARTVVDGVAFAPHRAVDVEALGCDWYVFSTYKVYGPHMAVLWGRRDAAAGITGPNHFFVPKDELPYKLELGGAPHESCAGWLAVGRYLSFLAGRDEDAPVDRETVVAAFDEVARLEAPLTGRLLDFLAADRRFRVIGPATADERRVPTVSFVHADRSCADVVAVLHAANVAVRNGHMYARRLCEPLGLDPADGVVRISAVHYNTVAEIDRALDALDTLT